MDPDPHSLTDPVPAKARRPWWRRSRTGEAAARSAAESGPVPRAQAEQDAWLARWPGWDQCDRSTPPGAPTGPPPIPPSSAPVSSVPGRPRRVSNWVFAVLGLVLGMGIAGGMLIDVPYVALVPGTARDTEPLLEVDGIEAYPSEGELLFTTVRVRQRPNLWEYLWLQFDDDATVVPEEDILGDRTPEENRQVNLELMNDSKQVAVAVALEELGYDAIGTDGVVIQQVVLDTPADGVLEVLDTIVAIDGRPTTSTTDLIDILGGAEPGDRIELTVEDLAGTTSETVEVTLIENPERPGAGFLGIQPVDRIRYGTDLDFTVEIDSGSVGGPSAGLAFTLAVLDDLTAGELTGGERVAVTGTIRADGSVGRVGGVLQKTAAVRELGVHTFLVPAELGEEEIDQLRERAGDDLTIIPVEDLGEALDVLGGLGGDVGAVEEYAAGNPAAG
jgi:Lon-like protease